MSPATYCVASSGAMEGAKTTSKNSTASAAMVKGLISQFTASVMRRPFGCRATPATAPKSTPIIIG